MIWLNSEYDKKRREFIAQEQGWVRGWKITNIRDKVGGGEILLKAGHGDQTSPE